jgi:GPH family glycoside/pentoside/hexuronide:cation symporter
MSKYTIGSLGTLIPAGLIPILAARSDSPGSVYSICTVVLAILGALCYLSLYFSSREISDPRREKIAVKDVFTTLLHNPPWIKAALMYFLYSVNYAIMTGMLLFYAANFWKRPGLVTPVLVSILGVLAIGSAFANPLVAKFGKRRVIQFGMILAILSLLVRLATGDQNILISTICLAAQFLGMGYCVILGNPIISDTVAYGEWKFGKRIESLSFSALTLGNNLALGIGGAAASYMLDFAGYVPGSVEQPSRVIAVLFASEVYMPLVFAALILIVVSTYELDGLLPGIHRDLASRKSGPYLKIGEAPEEAVL